VISWVLPQREATKADNRAQDLYPSERWVMARFPGAAEPMIFATLAWPVLKLTIGRVFSNRGSG
jgi:hypothetical protein